MLLSKALITLITPWFESHAKLVVPCWSDKSQYMNKFNPETPWYVTVHTLVLGSGHCSPCPPVGVLSSIGTGQDRDMPVRVVNKSWNQKWLQISWKCTFAYTFVQKHLWSEKKILKSGNSWRLASLTRQDKWLNQAHYCPLTIVDHRIRKFCHVCYWILIIYIVRPVFINSPFIQSQPYLPLTVTFWRIMLLFTFSWSLQQAWIQLTQG